MSDAAAAEPEEDSSWSHGGAQPHPPPTAVQFSWLLRLPGRMEADFWASADVTRLLCVMDVLAFVMVVPNVVAAMLGRVNRSLPEGVQLPLGAKAILLLYWLVSALPVAVMLPRFRLYKRHRTALAIASRLYRLVGAALLTHPSTVLGYVTQVAAVRQAALAGDIRKSLLVNTLLPTILHVQQSNCLLSFRLSLLFQLGLFGVAVAWAQGMPGYLLLPAAAAGASGGPGEPAAAAYLAQLPLSALVTPDGIWPSTSTSRNFTTLVGGMAHRVAASGAGQEGAQGLAAAALQHAGSSVCQKMQLLHDVMLAPFAAPFSVITPGRLRLCEGAAAFQLLYLFVAALLLLVVTPASTYWLERYAKQRWLKLQGVAVAVPVHSQVHKQLWQTVWLHAAKLVLPLSCCWVASEALTARLDGCCRPPLNGAVAWISSLF